MIKPPRLRGLLLFFLSVAAATFALGAVYLPAMRDRARIRAESASEADSPQAPRPATAPGTMLLSVGMSDGAADLFLLIRLDPPQDRVALLSLPPETRSTRDNRTDTLRGFYEYAGVREVIGAIEHLCAIEIDRHMHFTAAAFARSVDVMGGFSYEMPGDIYYKSEETGYTIALGSGLKRLDGSAFLSVLHYNRLTGQRRDGHSLESRMFSALLHQTVTPDGMSRADSVFTAMVNEAETDISMTDYLGARDALTYMAEIGMPGVVLAPDGEYAPGGSEFFLSEQSIAEIQENFGSR